LCLIKLAIDIDLDDMTSIIWQYKMIYLSHVRITIFKSISFYVIYEDGIMTS